MIHRPGLCELVFLVVNLQCIRYLHSTFWHVTLRHILSQLSWDVYDSFTFSLRMPHQRKSVDREYIPFIEGFSLEITASCMGVSLPLFVSLTQGQICNSKTSTDESVHCMCYMLKIQSTFNFTLCWKLVFAYFSNSMYQLHLIKMGVSFGPTFHIYCYQWHSCQDDEQ